MSDEDTTPAGRRLKIETVTRRFGEAAARLIAEVREAEGDDRRALIAGISKAAMAEGVDAEAAGALAHLINTHGK